MEDKKIPLRFSVDMKYLDLGAIVELNDDNGIMFETPEERGNFFNRAQQDPKSVPYGAALSHAKATDLGVWGKDDSLYADCVRLMAAELRRLEVETGQNFGITEEMLANSMEFRLAYAIVRTPKRAALNNLARSIGRNSESIPYQEVMIDRDVIERLSDLHRNVILELKGGSKANYHNRRTYF